MLQRLDPHFDPSQLKLLVYDLDGTLVDAFEDIWAGVNHAMRSAGLPELPFEQVKSYVGDGAQVLIERCLGDCHAQHFDTIFPVFRAFYSENPNPRAHPYPGVVATLPALRARGLRQAVLSNKPHEVTLLTCNNLGLTPLLDAIWGEEAGRPRKPSAAALELVMRHFGVAPHETAMVGDGPADHAVARAAGCPMLAVTYGLLPREQILALRPAALLNEFTDLQVLFSPATAASSA
jgi:phosphoglycolate phosphatase